MKHGQAVVVLPADVRDLTADSSLQRWLSRGVLSRRVLEREMLAEVLSVIGAPVPDTGYAALRFWGQTGERSSSWIAAADPVHYQARLRDVRIRPLPIDANTKKDIRDIFNSLHEDFEGEGKYSLVRLGTYGYLRAREPMNLPVVSAGVAAGDVPDKYTPAGATARSYHQLLGELQMSLHDHKVNLRRQEAGLPGINSLWLWGGGSAPEAREIAVPDLYSADALFAGYWASANGTSRPWKSFENCVESSPRGFVAVVDANVTENVSAELAVLARMLNAGKLRRLVLLFHDGLRIELGSLDRLKFWRGISPLLVPAEANAI